MGDDHGRGGHSDGISENLARMYEAGVQKPSRYLLGVP